MQSFIFKTSSAHKHKNRYMQEVPIPIDLLPRKKLKLRLVFQFIMRDEITMKLPKTAWRAVFRNNES